MSDTGGGGEPDVAGGSRFGGNTMGRIGRTFVGVGARLGNVSAQTNEFKDLTTAVNSVTASLKKLSQESGGYADTIARNMNKVTTSLGGGASAGQVAGSGYAATARSQASAAQNSTGNTNPPAPSTNNGGSGMNPVSWLGGTPDNTLVPNLMMAPLRFMRDRIQNNRNVVLSASNMLNMTGLRAGVGQDKMLEALGSQVGNVKGSAADIIGMFANTGQLGASYGFGNQSAQGVRAGGFFQGIQQMQALNPGASVQSMVGALGGQAANTGAQQQSIMMTGGAFSMIGGGGRQKSLSEWGDSILKWLQDLRPGDKRGTPFSYGELMAQYFPGSNIDAWFNANGVSAEMKEYWWTYALGKANKSVAADASGNLFQVANPAAMGAPDPKVTKNNLAALKLSSTNALTQGEFSLGARMSGAYGNKEQSNRMFNEMIQKFLVSALPGAISDGVLGFMQYMPDIIEDLLMGLLERAPGNFQTMAGGLAIADMFIGGQDGDVGDMPGSYGAQGGTTTSGMHPDMRRKLGAMQRANPRIKITSGLRDTGLQQRLKKAGHTNVSGKPSAHTRGMAADLGPRSEYGWIAKNASKFGLKSGKNQGEPWHVGMGDHIGDVGDITDDILGLFTGVMGGGEGSSNAAEGMFGLMGQILGLLGKGLNSKPVGQQGGTTFQADLYDRLLLKDNEGLPIRRTLPGIGVGGGGGGGTAPGAGGGTSAAPPNADAGTRAAHALWNAGFRDEDLDKIVAIAKRESGWDAGAANTNGEDKGLLQINIKAQKGRIAALGYTNAELMDIQKNANVAYRIFQDSGNFSAWNFSEKSMQWGPPARAGWAPNNNVALGGGPVSPFFRTNIPEAAQIVDAAGLGDMPEYQTPSAGVARQGNVVFVNTFNLQGGGAAGPGGGIDIRRTVTMMADHLENEMKTRLARVS